MQFFQHVTKTKQIIIEVNDNRILRNQHHDIDDNKQKK